MKWDEMGRYDIYNEIQQLDPRTDNERIVYLVGAYEFPFEVQRSLEMALLRTFAIPRMSALLDQTGSFKADGQKRYDATALIVSEIAEHGYDSERGRAAIRQMNRAHRRFAIENEDFLYVLSTFIFEPIYWNKLLAWRRSSEKEKLANYYFWVEIGKRMNIQDIPETYEAFEQFKAAYEEKYMVYAPSNARVAEASIQTFLNWFPRFTHSIGRRVAYALMDDRMREAFGYPRQPKWLVWLVHRGIRLRAWLVKMLPPRRKPFLFTQLPNRTYPANYKIEELGS
ncbi:MAG: hypothetical protein OHK0046_25110 [Anaerolineae bacterium]